MILIKFIPVGRGHFAIVNEDNFERLSKHRWHMNNGYPRRYNGPRFKATGNRGTTPMHAEVLEVPPGFLPDHSDRDKTNNTRENLRVVTYAANSRNRGVQKNNSSGVRGVLWHKRDKKWYAYIKVDRKIIHLGYFKELKEATAVRLAAAIKYHGEYRGIITENE